MITVTTKINRRAIQAAKLAMRERAKKAEKHTISLGIHDDDNEIAVDYKGVEGSITLLQLALIHEFGAGNVPPRPFLASWFDQNLSKLKREAIAAMRATYRGDHSAFSRQGNAWKNEFVDWMRGGEGSFEGLAPATIKAREDAGLPGEPPLVATEQLINAVRVLIDGE